MKWRKRRNYTQSKVSDVKILTPETFRIINGKMSQRSSISAFRQQHPKMVLPERSRFNRRVRQLGWLVRFIRNKLCEKTVDTSSKMNGIVDSFPIPVCQTSRNLRAKLFKNKADIGFNVTKKISFYGFKAHVEINFDGYILNYVITKASIHDTKEAPELIMSSPCHHILADVGCVGKNYTTI